MDETLEKFARGFRIERVKQLLLDLFAQLLNGFPIDPRVSQERCVELGAFWGFLDEELGHGRIENQFDTLKQNRVLDKDVVWLLDSKNSIGDKQLQFF